MNPSRSLATFPSRSIPDASTRRAAARLASGCALALALGASSCTSGEIRTQTDVPANVPGIGGKTLTVTARLGDPDSGGDLDVPASPSAAGLCLQIDWLGEDGMTGSTTIPLDGSQPIGEEIPAGSVGWAGAVYAWQEEDGAGDTNAIARRFGLTPGSRDYCMWGETFAPDTTVGARNRRYSISLHARSLAAARDIEAMVLSGELGDPLPTGVVDLYMEEREPLADGNVLFRAARLGSGVQQFALELNGVQDYATLLENSAVHARNGWAWVEVEVASADLNLGAQPGATYDNTWLTELVVDGRRTTQPFAFRYSVP